MARKQLPVITTSVIYLVMLASIVGYTYLLNQGHIEVRNRALYETYRSYAMDLHLISTLLDEVDVNPQNIGYAVLLLQQAHSTARIGELLSGGDIWAGLQEAIGTSYFVQTRLSNITGGKLLDSDVAKLKKLGDLYHELSGILFRNFPVDERLHKGNFSTALQSGDLRNAARIVFEIRELTNRS